MADRIEALMAFQDHILTGRLGQNVQLCQVRTSTQAGRNIRHRLCIYLKVCNIEALVLALFTFDIALFISETRRTEFPQACDASDLSAGA